MRRFFLSLIREGAFNNRTEMWAWILQRITGLALTLYIIPHIIVLSSARGGPEAFDRATVGIQSPVWHLFDIALLAGFIIHSANGIRITAVDVDHQSRRQKIWLRAMLILGGIVMIMGTISLIRKMLVHY